MPLRHRYTLVCDEVRREDTGKLLIIGLYTPSILLRRFPARLPKLTFVSCLEPETAGTWELSFQLTHEATGAIVGPAGHLRLEATAATGPVVVAMPVLTPQFQMEGNYVFSVTGDGFEGATAVVPVRLRREPTIH